MFDLMRHFHFITRKILNIIVPKCILEKIKSNTLKKECMIFVLYLKLKIGYIIKITVKYTHV